MLTFRKIDAGTANGDLLPGASAHNLLDLSRCAAAKRYLVFQRVAPGRRFGHTQLRELLDKRDALEEEIITLVGGVKKEWKSQACSVCGETGHSARSCDKKKPVIGTL